MPSWFSLPFWGRLSDTRRSYRQPSGPVRPLDILLTGAKDDFRGRYINFPRTPSSP